MFVNFVCQLPHHHDKFRSIKNDIMIRKLHGYMYEVLEHHLDER
jgi:hypothetical protein